MECQDRVQVETLKQSPISDPAVAYRDFIRSQPLRSMKFTREPSAVHHLVSLAYNVTPHQYLRLFPGRPHRTKRGIRSKGRQLSDGSLDLIHGYCTRHWIYTMAPMPFEDRRSLLTIFKCPKLFLHSLCRFPVPRAPR